MQPELTQQDKQELAAELGVSPEQIGDPMTIEEVAAELKDQGISIDEALAAGTIDESLAEELRKLESESR